MKGARTMRQFNVRMSDQLKDWLTNSAQENKRSINSEINFRLEKSRLEDENKAA